MFRPRMIRYILIAVAVYLSLIGLMFVFQQGLAESVFAIGILDASAHRGWGVCLLILAALSGVSGSPSADLCRTAMAADCRLARGIGRAGLRSHCRLSHPPAIWRTACSQLGIRCAARLFPPKTSMRVASRTRLASVKRAFTWRPDQNARAGPIVGRHRLCLRRCVSVSSLRY